MSEENLTYYQRNRERLLAQANKYRTEHRERYRTYWRTYYLNNKEELIQRHKEYAQKNKEYLKEKQRTIYYPRHQAKKKKIRQPDLPPAALDEIKQEKSKDVFVYTSVTDPSIEIPAFSMIVSRGDHNVTFD